MNQVTPNLEHIPRRSYIRRGKIIQCFKVLECIRNSISYNNIICTPDDPIWLLNLPSEEAAEALMEDLYYGEYTGA